MLIILLKNYSNSNKSSPRHTKCAAQTRARESKQTKNYETFHDPQLLLCTLSLMLMLMLVNSSITKMPERHEKFLRNSIFFFYFIEMLKTFYFNFFSSFSHFFLLLLLACCCCQLMIDWCLILCLLFRLLCCCFCFGFNSISSNLHDQ